VARRDQVAAAAVSAVVFRRGQVCAAVGNYAMSSQLDR